jgi:type I restriction enzyme M protein
MDMKKKSGESLLEHRLHPIAVGLRQEHLRRHAPLQLRQRPAVRAGADLDPVPAHPRCAGSARPEAGRGGGREPSAPALRAPYRWQDWAAPWSDKPSIRTPEGQPYGWKRRNCSPPGRQTVRVHQQGTAAAPARLDVDPRSGLPNPAASPKQRIIGRIMTAVERVRVDSRPTSRHPRPGARDQHRPYRRHHFFTLSQVYEDLLLKMGEKNSDGGQFFTPREVIRAMVHTVDPTLGRRCTTPAAAPAAFWPSPTSTWRASWASAALSTDIDTLKHETFFGREKENLVFPDRAGQPGAARHRPAQPVARQHADARAHLRPLFEQAPATFDVILTNPPFGGKEGQGRAEELFL